MNRRSPLAPVKPDDPPRAYCPDCGNKWNPYAHGQRCPRCDDE